MYSNKTTLNSQALDFLLKVCILLCHPTYHIEHLRALISCRVDGLARD